MDIQSPIVLLVVGMGTVFIALLIIIYLGEGLIRLVNRFFPEDENPAFANKQTASVSPKTAQAISAAVQIITNNKGMVEKIKKI
ncbi:MAG: oxaloacetate decarboxylase [Bacteroidia bacterium]|nr:oxaloacetate decarboxylase [Bacteroidia bacterium]